jgi:hypothetical protein
LQLIPQSDIGESGGSIGGAFSMIHRSDTTKLDLEPQLEFVRYPHDHLLDRDVLQIAALGTKYFDTAEWDAQANYVRDTTAISELGTSGVTQSNQPHERVAVALSPSSQLTEKWSMNASLSWSNDSYPHKIDPQLVDYDYSSVVAQLAYAFTERGTAAIDASFGELFVPSERTITHQYGANLHLDVTMSERQNFSLAAGPVHVVSDFITDSGYGYSARLNSQFETGALNVTLGRDVIPNGRGVLEKRDHALGYFNHSWSSRWSSDLSLQWQRSIDIVPTFNAQLQDVRYASIDTSLRWLMTPTISAVVSVGWSRQEQAVIVGAANAYRAVFSLQWQGLERTL